MTGLFWLSLFFIAYVYVGYPALLAVWARLRPKPWLVRSEGAALPGVSIVVAARNEGKRLPARLDNLLALAYPADRRQVIVVSDGSTDDTLAVLDRYRPMVNVVAIAAAGKAAALNAGVARAQHQLLVFADARQSFAPDALLELTRPFQDPLVGAVSGQLVLECESAGRRLAERRREPAGVGVVNRRLTERRLPSHSTIAEGIGLYWKLEKWMRHRESQVASMLGTTGAIYAMRRGLWRPLPPDTILDDVLAPMRCVLAGYRVVFNERACAFDRPAADADAESRRKIRTLAGNYQAVWFEPRLLAPWRNAVWFQYASHKLGRLLVPYALIALLVASIVLAEHSIVYASALAGQCAFYFLAGYGAWLDWNDSAGRQKGSGRERSDGWVMTRRRAAASSREARALPSRSSS